MKKLMLKRKGNPMEDKTIRKCSSCGKVLEPDDDICTKCGALFEENGESSEGEGKDWGRKDWGRTKLTD
jgi:uncharacterized OB-fold protein